MWSETSVTRSRSDYSAKFRAFTNPTDSSHLISGSNVKLALSLTFSSWARGAAASAREDIRLRHHLFSLPHAPSSFFLLSPTICTRFYHRTSDDEWFQVRHMFDFSTAEPRLNVTRCDTKKGTQFQNYNLFSEGWVYQAIQQFITLIT